jgi:hypothetical protein
MKIVINTIAVIVLSVQFFSFAFNALNQKKPESTLDCFLIIISCATY